MGPGPERTASSPSILKLRTDSGAFCFSVLRAGRPWQPCLYDELTELDVRSIARHAFTHGGFTVPGMAIRLDDEPDA